MNSPKRRLQLTSMGTDDGAAHNGDLAANVGMVLREARHRLGRTQLTRPGVAHIRETGVMGRRRVAGATGPNGREVEER